MATATATHRLTKDGKPITEGSRDDCLIWLIHNCEAFVPCCLVMSTELAIKHHGYELEKIT